MIATKFLRLANLVVLLVVVSTFTAMGGRPNGERRAPDGFHKPNTNDVYHPMLINNIFSYYSNNGDGDFNPFTADDEGFEVSKGSGGQVGFEEGLVWTGYSQIAGEAHYDLKCGGSTYWHGLQAGKILTPGTPTTRPVAEDAGLAKNRIFRVRPDIHPSNDPATVAAMEAALATDEIPYVNRYESYTAASLYQAYIDDWNNWPAADGAPYTDVNGNGIYDPTVDIPGVPGADQTMWYVANDMDLARVTGLYGSADALGLEMQRTIWAYKRSAADALGNTIFASTLLINKSGVQIDTMYISSWADPDVGGSLGYRDNFSGCDTATSLGYTYSGTNFNGFYGDAAPAYGKVFLQGPKVFTGNSSDSALFQLKYRHGYRPLAGYPTAERTNPTMTTFNFFVNGSATYTDPRHSAAGTEDWYNLMRGLVAPSGAPYTDPTTGLTTKFLLYGDPVRNTGWVDGQIAPPDDRRMCLITGPFTMAPGDTQEIVVGSIAAQGARGGRKPARLQSVSLLKYYTSIAQIAYNKLFKLAPPPPAPHVQATELDGEIVLYWGDSSHVAATEGQDTLGYKFVGYNVYQLSNQSFANPKLLATYITRGGPGEIDEVVFDQNFGGEITEPVQQGSPTGVQRFLSIKSDAFGTYGTGLVNGEKYYFAVTAFNWNGTQGTRENTFECSPEKILEVIPKSPDPGTRIPIVSGSTLSDSTKLGFSDGQVIARVIDPTKITGHQYKVAIDTTGGVTGWYVIDLDLNKTIIAKQKVYPFGDSTYLPIADGLQFAVNDLGAAGGFKSVLLTQDSGGVAVNPPVSVLRASAPSGKWRVDAINSTSVANALSILNTFNNSGSDDYEVRFTAGGSEYYTIPFNNGSSTDAPKAANRIPFELWDVTTNTRMIAKTFDQHDPPTGWDTLTYTTYEGWDRFAWVVPLTPYLEPNPATSGTPGPTDKRIGQFIFVDITHTKYVPPTGVIVRLTTNKPIKASDGWIFRTASVKPTIGDAGLAKLDVNKINVFPNPYYGFNLAEVNKYNRFVTFNHLPPKATIRIFNLAGVLVRVVAKNDQTQFAQWDLSNESGIPSAAGVYIAFIDMPDLGVTKTLKFSIIPETQFLDRY